ncbi:MAG TPA: crotonase/enoyl-CoA hydratase family protein [Steroidobacteraceae bacterium]|nr:crotonase/enoyl-CoA hydratase family protein [Steroidobacteraceae bacterium]
MNFENILYQVEDRVLTVTLNRPDRMNACTVRMYEELIEAFDRADADDEVKAIIVTGAGRAFCAGADLERGAETWGVKSDLTDLTKQERYIGNGGGRIVRRIFDCHKPVIAALNGAAVGVGITMTLAMDIRLAVKGAKIGFVFASRGIVPEACSSWFLPRIVGISKALEWCYSARIFRTEEGLEAGLFRTLHEADDLLPAARALAKEFADNSSAVSMTLTRHMLWRMLGASHPLEAHEVDTAAMNALGQSTDAREGITAFLEKRTPSFKDRVSQHLPKFFPWWKDRPFRHL